MTPLSRKHRLIIIIALSLLLIASGYLAGRNHLIGNIRNKLLSRIPIIWHNMRNKPVTKELTSNWWLQNLRLRRYQLANDPNVYDTELDSHFVYDLLDTPVNKTALILVDVWENHPNDGWLERAKKNIMPNIREVLQSARKHNMLIIHAAANRAEAVETLPNEIIIDHYNKVPDDEELDSILKHRDIKTLFYVGFATNMWVLNRPYGMKSMHSLGYKVILIRDCTTGFEFHDTLDGRWATRLAVRFVERKLGYSTTSRDFLKSFIKRIP